MYYYPAPASVYYVTPEVVTQSNTRVIYPRTQVGVEQTVTYGEVIGIATVFIDRSTGLEITVKTDDDRTIAITQLPGERFVTGDRVKILTSPNGLARVERLIAANGLMTINIPNSDGTYTPVQISKRDGGYTGPQGEFYSGHPTVDQLKILYGK